jgi:hypothetical protein
MVDIIIGHLLKAPGDPVTTDVFCDNRVERLRMCENTHCDVQHLQLRGYRTFAPLGTPETTTARGWRSSQGQEGADKALGKTLGGTPHQSEISLFADRARSFHFACRTDVAHVHEPSVYRRRLSLLRLHGLIAARALHDGKSSPTVLRCHSYCEGCASIISAGVPNRTSCRKADVDIKSSFPRPCYRAGSDV